MRARKDSCYVGRNKYKENGRTKNAKELQRRVSYKIGYRDEKVRSNKNKNLARTKREGG